MLVSTHKYEFVFKSLKAHHSLSSLPNVVIQCAGRKWTAEDCIPPPSFDDIDMPEENRLLKPMPKGPDLPPVHRQRKMHMMRGPCIGEKARLEHAQFGVIALKGGRMQFKHFHLIQTRVNRFLKNKPMFAKWRVEEPYHPVTRHPIQAVMGGGKGAIDHYVTPVRARRVVFEIGGKAQFVEVLPLLRGIAMVMPFQCKAVSKEMLDAMYEEERLIEEDNENFFTFRELIEKNMQGIRSKVTMYDFKHFGKMR